MAGIVEKLERSLQRTRSSPTHVWWDGPQDHFKRRELAEVDSYHIWDREAGQHRLADPRWRKITESDQCLNMLRFAPGPEELSRGKKIPPQRPENSKTSLCWKLDPYGVRTRSSSFGTEKSRFLEFSSSKEERFRYNKVGLKDYTKVGWATNVIKVPIKQPRKERSSSAASLPASPAGTLTRQRATLP